MKEEDVLSLSGKVWVSIPRLSSVIPFGYAESPTDPHVLEPVIFELEALEVAKTHRKKGHSWRKLAAWLEATTGRHISDVGLKKRVESDARHRRKATTLANWARRAKDALQKAKEHDQKVGNDTSIYDDALRSLIRDVASSPSRRTD
jgi:hypothetical protein